MRKKFSLTSFMRLRCGWLAMVAVAVTVAVMAFMVIIVAALSSVLIPALRRAGWLDDRRG
jgi:Na+-transporting NADH:ubiquinone oxidoreductase subunit NqrD